jgi:hypothetical protein
MTAPIELRTVAIADLQPDPENARVHSERNISAIAKSLSAFGQRKPIVIAGTTIVAGNGTVEAAKRLGWTEITAVDYPADRISEARAYAIADNRTGELSLWDNRRLKAQLDTLGAGLAGVAGFTWEEIDDLVSPSVNIPVLTVTDGDRAIADFYAMRASRSFLFRMPVEQYEWAIDRLRETRTRLGVESNAEAVERLILDAINTEEAR